MVDKNSLRIIRGVRQDGLRDYLYLTGKKDESFTMRDLNSENKQNRFCPSLQDTPENGECDRGEVTEIIQKGVSSVSFIG